MDIMKPIVNINGTDKDSLVNMRLDARRAILKAVEAIQEMVPHGRDYIGATDAYNADLKVYRERQGMLNKIYNDLELEALAIRGDD